jgi:predicted nucleotide-binding protein
MSVFYSHSTKNNQSYETFLKINEKLKDNIIDVDNNPKNFSRLLDRITYHIKKADIFVCDLTPYLPDYSYPNPNVMLELGYALEQFENNNIIYILNENYKITLPTMIEGVNLIKYKFEDTDEYYSEIVECIKSSIKNLYDNKGWTNFKYYLSDIFLSS